MSLLAEYQWWDTFENAKNEGFALSHAIFCLSIDNESRCHPSQTVLHNAEKIMVRLSVFSALKSDERHVRIVY